MNGSGTGENRWEQSGDDWYFIKSDGTRAAGEWMNIDGEEYWFDADGVMATGWRQAAGGEWYYFNPESDGTLGLMAVNQVIDSYYVDSDGKMNEP